MIDKFDPQTNREDTAILYEITGFQYHVESRDQSVEPSLNDKRSEHDGSTSNALLQIPEEPENKTLKKMNQKVAKKSGHWSYNFDKHRYLWKAGDKKGRETQVMVDEENDLSANLLGEEESQKTKYNNRKSKQINQMFKRSDPNTFWEDYESYKFEEEEHEEGYDSQAIELVEGALNFVN